MNILFVHQNFPGQFKHLAPALAQAGHRVVAMSMKKNTPTQWRGVQIHPYRASRSSTKEIHPWLVDFETKVIRGEAALQQARLLQEAGFNPDIIIAHPGWGESLFLKDVWPAAKLSIYCEFFYNAEGGDVGFDPEFNSKSTDDASRLKIKNLGNTLQFDVAAAGIAPTHWQASTFPSPFREKISVIHDGIDTRVLVPNAKATLTLKTSKGESRALTRNDEIITFVNRNLEPYRGFHVFMRGLPELLRRRPEARVVIVGANGNSYGGPPKDGGTWKQKFTAEIKDQMTPDDWERVHFVGTLAYQHFISLLQLSRVHVYWTYPFVLSWSLLEAMSVGCSIVASDTQPLHEAIRHNDTGKLVDFFDRAAMIDTIDELLGDADQRARLGDAARQFARQHYDLASVCLPQQLQWVDNLAAS